MRSLSASRITFLILISTIIISFVLALLTQALFLLSFVDTATLLALLLITAGAGLWVLQGGMFDGFIHTFKKFYSRTDKVAAYVEEQEKEIRRGSDRPSFDSMGSTGYPMTLVSHTTRPARISRNRFTYPLLIAGIVLFVLCYAAALFM